MATYCISDIHGMYDRFRAMLETLRLREEDTLYVLGDMVDYGPEPLRLVRDLMERPNVAALAGNHELTACMLLRRLIHGGRQGELTDEAMADTLRWSAEGGAPTLREFRALSVAQRREVVDWLSDLPLYAEVEAGGARYVLVHAGLGPDFSPARALDSYDATDYLLGRPDYDRVCFPDRVLVTGHTPTRTIHGADRIYRAKGHIAIDCGASLGGALAAVCLETGEEFYV